MKARDAFSKGNKPTQDEPDTGPNEQLMSEYRDSIHENEASSHMNLVVNVPARQPKNHGTAFFMVALLMAVGSSVLLNTGFYTLGFLIRTPVVEIFNPMDGVHNITQRFAILSCTPVLWDSFNDPKDKALQLSPPNDPTPRTPIPEIIRHLAEFINDDVECLMYPYQKEPYGYKGPNRDHMAVRDSSKHWTLANRTSGEFLDLRELVTKWSFVSANLWFENMSSMGTHWGGDPSDSVFILWLELNHRYLASYKHEDWFLANTTELRTGMRESNNGSHSYGFPPPNVSGLAKAVLRQYLRWAEGHYLGIPLRFLEKCEASHPSHPPPKFRSVHPACWLMHKKMENMTLDGRVTWLRDRFIEWVDDRDVLAPDGFELVFDDVWPANVTNQPLFLALATSLVGLEFDASRLLKIARALSVADLPDPPPKRFSWHRVLPWARADTKKRLPPATCLARLREDVDLLEFVLENYLVPQVRVILHTVIEFGGIAKDLMEYKNTLTHLLESPSAWVRIDESTGQRVYTKMPLLLQQHHCYLNHSTSISETEMKWTYQATTWRFWDTRHIEKVQDYFDNQARQRKGEVGE